MHINFTKLEGLGNDFILIDLKKYPNLTEPVIKNATMLCDRHFGIGADGILLFNTSTIADYQMRVINSDGSEPEMCGNGIRCFAAYIRRNYDLKETLTIETLAGIKEVTYNNELYTVDMGAPILEGAAVPVKLNQASEITNPQALTVNDHSYLFSAVSMGNPHCIINVDSLADVDFHRDAPAIETNNIFPEKTNVEFIKIDSRTKIDVKVWERGSGETLACGTGACAVTVSQVLLGNVDADKDIEVKLPGGSLTIRWKATKEQLNEITQNPKVATETTVLMSGPAKIVFEGTLEI